MSNIISLCTCLCNLSLNIGKHARSDLQSCSQAPTQLLHFENEIRQSQVVLMTIQKPRLFYSFHMIYAISNQIFCYSLNTLYHQTKIITYQEDDHYNMLMAFYCYSPFIELSAYYGHPHSIHDTTILPILFFISSQLIYRASIYFSDLLKIQSFTTFTTQAYFDLPDGR